MILLVFLVSMPPRSVVAGLNIFKKYLILILIEKVIKIHDNDKLIMIFNTDDSPPELLDAS